MTYKEFIDNILNSRGRFNLDGIYHERHHILPRCLNGTEEESNLIDLTPKEHFQAHKLLVEENPNNISLMGALVMVTFMRSSNQERYIPTDDEYEYVKVINRKFVSLSQKGLLWCYHIDTYQLKRFRLDKIPDDYVLGLPSNYVGPTKGTKMSDDTKRKLSIAKKGKHIGKSWFNNGEIEVVTYNCPDGFMVGRLPFNEDTKSNISKSMMGHTLSDKTKEKLSKSKTGKHCYNNGKITIRAKECPNGFKPGLLMKEKRHCRFYTNGKVNKKIYDGDIIPDGFYLGMAPNEKFNGRKWYTNGKINRWVKECPGDDFYIGKI